MAPFPSKTAVLTIAVLLATMIPKSAAANTAYLVTFGDSYSKTGFDSDGRQPSAEYPLGNPDLPGVTSSGGLNWVGYMVTEFNTSVTLSYNFAASGAVVDTDLVNTTTVDLVSQVDSFTSYYGTDGLPEGRTRYNTVVGVWMGVNDINLTFNDSSVDVSDLYPKIMEQYFDQMQNLYDLNTRKFVFIAAPPINLTPMYVSSSNETRSQLTSAIKLYNELLQSNFDSFKSTNDDIVATIVDPTEVFEEAVEDPEAYGAPNATCYNSDGVSCLWWNSFHPATAIERLVAGQVADVIDSDEFKCYGSDDCS